MTLEVLAKQMERLESNWGAPKDRTAGQMVAMTREWFTQLARFGEHTVTNAFTHVIGHHKFQWAGVFPEVLGHCERDHREWREIVELQLPALPAPKPEPFERDGRTTAEEIEFRAREIAAMKKIHGARSLAQIDVEENSKREIKPASQEMHVSEAVLNSKLVREYRARTGRRQDTATNQPRLPHTASGDCDGQDHGPN